MDDKIPPHWQRVLDAAGFSSANELGARAAVHTTTVMRLFRGEGVPSPGTITAIRTALKLTVEDMADLTGRRVPTRTEMPAEYGLLSRRQQSAIVGVIKAMLEPENLSEPASTNVASIEAPKRRRGTNLEADARTDRAARRGSAKSEADTNDH